MTKIQTATKALGTASRKIIEELVAQYVAAQRDCGIVVGDTVKVLRLAKSYNLGWENSWEPKMTEVVGSSFIVEGIRSSGIQLRVGQDLALDFPFFVLEKFEDTKTVTLNEDYAALVSQDSVVVGCQTFPWSKIEEIIEAHNRLVRV